jgi:hypothetical protein
LQNGSWQKREESFLFSGTFYSFFYFRELFIRFFIFGNILFVFLFFGNFLFVFLFSGTFYSFFYFSGTVAFWRFFFANGPSRKAIFLKIEASERTRRKASMATQTETTELARAMDVAQGASELLLLWNEPNVLVGLCLEFQEDL